MNFVFSAFSQNGLDGLGGLTAQQTTLQRTTILSYSKLAYYLTNGSTPEGLIRYICMLLLLELFLEVNES